MYERLRGAHGRPAYGSRAPALWPSARTAGLLAKRSMGRRTPRARAPGIQGAHLPAFLGSIRPSVIIPDVVTAFNTWGMPQQQSRFSGSPVNHRYDCVWPLGDINQSLNVAACALRRGWQLLTRYGHWRPSAIGLLKLTNSTCGTSVALEVLRDVCYSRRGRSNVRYPWLVVPIRAATTGTSQRPLRSTGSAHPGLAR